MAECFSIVEGLRRIVVIGALPVWLAGCSTLPGMSSADSDIGRIGTLLFHAVTGIGSANEVPREKVASIPYATLGVQLGSSDQSMLVLASKSGDKLLWLGGRRVAITTRNGRIVQTVGFAHNLSGVALTPNAAGNGDASSESYVYDFADRSRYGVAVRCSKSRLDRERVVIVEVPHDTDHVVEDCAAPQMDWQFRNEYWSDTSGFVWKSRQYVDPDLDALTLEILRPAE
jgi:hypothetical protein